MPPRINLFNQALAYRPRTTQILRAQPSLCRSYASDPSKDLPVAEKGEAGPNMQQAEHVSEEAAKMAKMTGGSGPDLEQGTPVQEVCNWILVMPKERAPQLKKLKLTNKYMTAPPGRRRSTKARASGAQGQHQEECGHPQAPVSPFLHLRQTPTRRPRVFSQPRQLNRPRSLLGQSTQPISFCRPTKSTSRPGPQVPPAHSTPPQQRPQGLPL